MTTIAEVEDFLVVFKNKMELEGIVFINRPKNREALFSLGIEANYRIYVLNNLTVDNYSQEPLTDHYGGTNIWVFGSHVAEYPLHYSFT